MDPSPTIELIPAGDVLTRAADATAAGAGGLAPDAALPARDLLLIAATPLLLGRGYRFEVNFLGKVATWMLYSSLGFVMVTDASTRSVSTRASAL